MRSFLLFTWMTLSSLPLWSQYHVYESGYNQISQTIIQTRDNGYLMAALEFCYTPNEWVIEGCPEGINLIKTDASGALQWSNEIPNTDILGIFHLYENSDSTYTLITSQDGAYMCGEIIIGPFFGLPQIVVYHLDASGNILSQKVFPRECELSLLSSARLTDTSFVVLTKYSDEFAGGNVEGRLLKMSSEGIVEDSLVFPSEAFQKGTVIVDSNHQAWVFYMDITNTLRLNVYDPNLTLLDQHFNATLDSACLSTYDTKSSFVFLPNGNILSVCINPWDTIRNLQFYVFTPELELIEYETHTVPYANGFTITANDEIVVVSEERTDSSDLRLSFFDFSGDFIESSIYILPGNQVPSQIIESNDNRLVVTGTHNCCNLDGSIGPGHSFLWISDQSTAVDKVNNINTSLDVRPNPARDYIRIETSEIQDAHKLSNLRIYSSAGMLMKETVIENNSTVSISDLPAGYYYLIIRNTPGHIRTGRFIKFD